MKNYLLRHIFIIKRSIVWLFQAIYLRAKTISRPIPKINLNGTSLVLLPHVDDEWIGCSQVLTSGHRVILVDMDMNGGDNYTIHLQRKEELKVLSKIFSLPIVCLKDKNNELLELIKLNKPAQIFVPFTIDWHPEHIQVANILKQTLKECLLDGIYIDRIISYNVSVPFPIELVNAYLPLDFYSLINKWKVFTSVYKSQTDIPRIRYISNEIIDGGYVGYIGAEFFYSVSMKSYIYGSLDMYNYSVHKLQTEINNIIKIRERLT